MQDQPQPAWEEEFDKEFSEEGIDLPDGSHSSYPYFQGTQQCKDIKNFIRSLLATERVKWQEEVLMQIANEFSVTRDLKPRDNTRPLERIAFLPFLTPPPQEETK